MRRQKRFRRQLDKYYVSGNMDFKVSNDEWENSTVKTVVTANSAESAVRHFITHTVLRKIIAFQLNKESLTEEDVSLFLEETQKNPEKYDEDQSVIICNQNIRVSRTGFTFDNPTVRYFDSSVLFNNGILVETNSINNPPSE